MAKKFYIQKDVEYKNGQVDTWYLIKLETEEGTQLVDLCRDNEEKANELLHSHDYSTGWHRTRSIHGKR